MHIATSHVVCLSDEANILLEVLFQCEMRQHCNTISENGCEGVP